MNSILIESNRQIADAQLKAEQETSLSKTSVSHTAQNNNAQWSTTIDSGIELRPGDQITMEACALNINGAGSQSFQQFNGQVDIPEKNGTFRKDNAVEFEIAYYTTNNIEFNFPLPAGKQMIELNPCMGGTYGSPTFNGRHLWRPVYGPGFDATTIHNVMDDPTALKTQIRPTDGLNDERLFNQNRGGYYWLGMNEDIEIPLATAGTPVPPPASKPAFAKGLANGAAYVQWCSQTPWLAAPGVQFGQSKGPLLPNVNAPFLDSNNEAFTASTLNLNVDIKDKYTNSGYFPNGLNGGANPLLLLQGAAPLNPRIVAQGTPVGSVTPGNLCGTIVEWAFGPQLYEYAPEQEPTIYKGAYLNHDPNQRKLYQAKRDDYNYWSKGPYYDTQNNYLIPTGSTGDPAMGGMVNFNKDDTPVSAQTNRDNHYWTFQTEKINVQLGTGNIAPSRIGEIITETFKARHGYADQPTEKFYKQRIWDTLTEKERKGLPNDFIERLVAGISSKSYATFPTLTGSCMEAANTLPPNTNNEFGWDMLNQDNFDITTLLPNLTENNSVGLNANERQMKNHYWANQLCGNPFEWRCVTRTLPLAMYRPFIDADIVPATFNHKHYSIYTGDTDIVDPNFPENYERIKADGTKLTIKVGQFGNMPCLLETPKAGLSTSKGQCFTGIHYPSEVTATSANPANNVGPWKINARPYGTFDVPGDDYKYKTLAPDDRDIILTNMIFDGQLRNDILNEEASNIEGHNITTSGDDTLVSQSVEFFNNTYVKWKIGRLNDQLTFPEQYSSEFFGNAQQNLGEKGVAQYLPNQYQTNKLLANDPLTGWDATQARGDINDILTHASSSLAVPPATQGTYRFCGLKTGQYANVNNPAYTLAFNPGSLYTNNPASGPTGAPYLSTTFGVPCWSFFRQEYLEDTDTQDGFKKICDRHMTGYRYLPQGQFTHPTTGAKYEYTALDAWNELIYTGLDTAKYSTRPAEMTYTKFEKIWNTITSLNDGKGCGWIPIFFNEPIKGNTFNSIPFLGVIYQGQSYKDMPLPEKGEFIFLGSSPSLSDNDLHLPATTQQKFEEEYKPGYVGMCPIDNPPTAPSLFQIAEFWQNQRNSSWATSSYAGSSDPIWVFDSTYNRYTFSKFHTNYFKGNGKFQYGNTDGVDDPDTREIVIASNPAAFSKQLTIPNGYIGYLTPTGAQSKQSLVYAEHIEGNIIWDYTNPGGSYGAGVPSVVNNAQYGSPPFGTQWEMKTMCVPGTQSDITADFPNNPNTGTIIGPSQLGVFIDFLVPSSLRPFPYIKAEASPYPTISAQSGIGLLGLSIPTTQGTMLKLSSSDYNRFQGTLLDKMGFSLNQLLPLYGKVQTQLNHTLFNEYTGPKAPAGKAYHNLLYPITTQAQITTSLTPALVNGFGVTKQNIPITAPVDLAMPFYNLGMLIAGGATQSNSESMFALSLPSKINFPYLVCRSNIMTPTALQYIGGPNGQQMLPAISYLMTNYATNDYFYNNRSDLVFSVNRPYVLTEIKTSIHLPNGQLADKILDENSAVIYRIDFAPRNIPEQTAEQKRADELFSIASGVKQSNR